jgi:hypothetical protein
MYLKIAAVVPGYNTRLREESKRRGLQLLHLNPDDFHKTRMASGHHSEVIICSCKYISGPGNLILFRFPISRILEASALIWRHALGATSATKVGENDYVTGPVIVTKVEVLVATTVSRSETALYHRSQYQ